MAYDDSKTLDAPKLVFDEGRLLLLNPFAAAKDDIVREVVHPETGEEMEVKLLALVNEENEEAAADVWAVGPPEAKAPEAKAQEAAPKNGGQPSLGLGEPPPEPEHHEKPQESGVGQSEDRAALNREDAGSSPAPATPKKKATRKKAARKKAARQKPPEPQVAKEGEVLIGTEIAQILPASYRKAPETTRRAGVSLAHVIRETTPVIQSVLPPDMSVERLRAVVGATLLAKNAEDLATCSRLSIAQALTRCAADGLVPDGEEAYIVPMPPPFGEGPKIATYIQKAQGIIRAFAREGVADKHRPCQGFEVFEGDFFSYDTLEGLKMHVPWQLRSRVIGQGDVPPRPKEKGEKLGWFIRWRFSDQSIRDSFIPQEDILKRRDMSPMWRNERSRAKSPWNVWPKEQEWKTAVRISAKEIPKPTMLSRLMARDFEPGGVDDPDWQPPAEDGTPAEHQLGAGTPDPMVAFEEGQ